ncbi:MAG: aspartate--tRNA ligase [Elusimicrobiota bacterium]
MPFRTHHCGKVNKPLVGTVVTLCGWVHSVRNHGGVIFIDLRDRSGIVQAVFNPKASTEKAAGAGQVGEALKPEYVLKISGIVNPRPAGTENPKLPTGEIEILVEDVEILNPSKTPVFELSDYVEVSEEVRLRYRYLDLRRQRLLKNLKLRNEVYIATRTFFAENGFLEVETPFLTKSTPEGARDFLVPSRLHPEKFYALPQSPQLFKQTLMVGGLERYFQIVRCFRDEDLRADRQPEFTQVDIELSFVDEEDVIRICEQYLSQLFQKVSGIELKLPFPRISYADAMLKYGSDKPDLRIPISICDLSTTLKNCGFKVFASVLNTGGAVRALAVPKGSMLSRQQIDNYIEYTKHLGGKGMAWFKVTETGIESNITKFFTPDELNNIKGLTDAKTGDIIFVIADKPAVAAMIAGELRLKVSADLKLVDDTKQELKFVWVVNFPLLEYSAEDKRWVAKHHPFTSANEDGWKVMEDIANGKQVTEEVIEQIRARAYDIVLNGNEIGGGSIRIHRPERQELMFKLLKLTPSEITERFGFLVDALSYGAPPHGGLAFGLDRLVALMCGEASIRDTIAFPKTQRGICPLTSAPDTVNTKQLKELHIKTDVILKEANPKPSDMDSGK